jgi:transcription antitermination protein NusB
VNTGLRHRAREAALQMLYLWEVGHVDPDAVAARYQAMLTDDGEALPESVLAFADHLVSGTIAELPRLDAAIERQAQNWRLARMAVIDRLILRLAAYELLCEPETPAGVAIDEALELARTFSEEDAVRFVNGVLDAVHKHRHD